MTLDEQNRLNRYKATQREIYIRLIPQLIAQGNAAEQAATEAERISEEATENFHPGFRCLAKRARQSR